MAFILNCFTGFLSEIGTKLRDWAVGQAWGSCYSWAAVSSNDSKTLYIYKIVVLTVPMTLHANKNTILISETLCSHQSTVTPGSGYKGRGFVLLKLPL